jgi:hypothetical protein
MSEYKLKTWSQFVYEKNLNNHQAGQSVDLSGELRRPDPNKVAMHYLKESQRAIRIEQQNGKAEPAPHWVRLGDTAAEALGAIETEDPREIAFAFYNLGQTAERLIHPSMEEQLTYLDAYIEKLKSEMPLRVSSERRNVLIEAIQEKARKKWATDSDKDFRLTEMCILMLEKAQEIANHIGTEVPIKASTLKPWLREVSPEHAKKKGRPRKSDLIMQSER